MHTVFALLCFVVVIHCLIFPYLSGLLHWHCGNLTIAQVPAKQPWWIWLNTSCELIMNDCITTTKQSTTKPCAYFLGYTVFVPGGLWGPTRPGIHHPALGKHLNFYYSPCFTIDLYNLRCVTPQNTTETGPRPHSQLPISSCRRWRHSNQWEAPGWDPVMLTENLQKGSIWGAIKAS